MVFSEDVFAEHMKKLNGSAIREIFHLLARPNMISFAGGNPSNAALEPDVVSELASEALAKYGTSLLQYGATEGFAPLRESIAEFVKTCGIETDPSCVLPVQGSQQAFDLLLKSLINPGDAILVESPTFLGALQAMKTYQAKLVPVETDEKGVIVEDLEAKIKEHHPKLIYIIPTFQNPTGITLAAERRQPIAEIAAKYGVVVAEDDPYRDLRYQGEALPAIKSYDKDGWVVYLSSFSKLVAPGLRVGAAIANPTLIRKMIIGKQTTDVHSPMLTQAVIDGYWRKGLLLPHIERIKVGYKEQLDAMLGAFDAFPAGVTHTTPEGGLFLWAKLPGETDALELLKKAVDKGVAYVPGTHFYPEAGTHMNTFRLNFSMCTVEKIREGMDKLREVIEENM